LEEFFPLGDAPEVETIRQRTLHVGARLEREAVAPPTSAPSTEARSIALAIDGGHVKAVRSYQLRSFEVFVAQASHHCERRCRRPASPGRGGQRRSRPGTYWIGFISPCAFSMLRRPPRAGRKPRWPSVRKVPALPTPSSIFIGVSGMARCGGLSILSAKPW